MKRLLRALLPERIRRVLRRWRRESARGRLAHRLVRLRARAGGLNRPQPMRRDFGCGSGRPVDRYYIERFLARHSMDIRGRVLEVTDDSYTRRYGGVRVEHCDILHRTPDNPQATIVGDLCHGTGLSSDRYDCVLLTQTLQYVPDPQAAIDTVRRILRPGGALLLTVPGISQISRYDMDRWGERWRFTSLAVRELLAESFPPEAATVEAHGNVLAVVAFLHGLVVEELRPRELNMRDEDYELVVVARAVKPPV